MQDIKTPEQNIVIDGGNRGSTVVDYLKAQGVKHLDLVIGTHPHADHIGGLINVFQSIHVTEVIDPGVVHTSKTFEDYLTLIDEKDIVFTEGRAGIRYDLGGGVSMELLYPVSPSESRLNDASIVTRITFGQVAFLFTGDAEQASERQMLSGGHDLQSTILKVGHHGSRTSTTNTFLKAVSPEVAIIMCGKDNTYGHPHQETLDKLAGIEVYRTDLHGTVVITTDGQTYNVNTAQAFVHQKIPEEEPEPVAVVGTININSASMKQLQDIIHIGAARAEEIIRLRPFKTLDDLTRVNGIGPARLKDIKAEGKAYVK